MARPGLHVVSGGKPPLGQSPEPETILAEIVPELIKAEETVGALRAMVDSRRRELAKKRGVAFIREERIRQEFGQ